MSLSIHDLDKAHLLYLLKDYISGHYEEPLFYTRKWIEKPWLTESSIKKWAAQEFIGYLMNDERDPFVAAEAYIAMVEHFSTISTEPGPSIIFSEAYDVALDLLDIMHTLI